jgi:hypothetical protein
MKAIAAFLILSAASISALSDAFLTPAGKTLGYCDFMYMYMAQLQQLKNNEGAAKAYLNRAAMMSVAFFITEEANGLVSGEKIKAARTPALVKKKSIDNNPDLIMREVKTCDLEGINLATQVRHSGKKLWGKSFDELQIDIFSKSRANLGIN